MEIDVLIVTNLSSSHDANMLVLDRVMLLENGVNARKPLELILFFYYGSNTFIFK